MTERTLYERLGGVDAIALVVDRFSDQIVTNPKLNVNPALKEYNEKGNLPSLKYLHITSEEFDEVGAEISRALDYFNVPEPEKQEVLGAIVARKAEVINPSR